MPEFRSDATSASDRSGRRILITTWGSLDDLHPYIALALGLKARGHAPVMATCECYRRKITSIGLPSVPVQPDCGSVADPAEVRWYAHPRWGLLRVAQIPLRCLRASCEELLAAAATVDLIVSNTSANAASLVAETTAIPWVSATHIPFMIFSPHDPPILPLAPGLSRRLRLLGQRFWGPFARSLNRMFTGHHAGTGLGWKSA